jgi:hypothetical protein
VSLNSQPLSAFADDGLDVGVYFAGFFADGQLPLNALAGAPRGLSIGVIIIYAVDICNYMGLHCFQSSVESDNT